MTTGPSGEQERFAMLTNRCHRLVRFLHEVALSQSDQVAAVEDNPLVVWLAQLPGGLSLFEHATAGEVALEAPAAAVLPSPPPLPDALAGWVVLPEPGDVPSDSPPLRETSLRSRAGWPDGIPLRPGGQPVVEGLAEPVRLVDRPEVPQAYQDWLPTWQIWAARARADADRRALHGVLHGVAGRLAQEGDGLELVLATGLLSWRAPDGRTLRRHLLTTRLAVEVDPVTSAIRLRVPDGIATRLEDGLLDGLPVFHAERTNALHERLRARPAAPLGGEDERLLRDWLTLALDVGHDGYSATWQPPGPPSDRPRVDLAPALVLRARGSAALLTYYEQMLDALRGEGRPPLGLVQLVETLEADERLAWLAAEGAASPGRLSDDPLFPLPANPEQAHVMERLRHDSGVIVEGPPGTGKTHTIANLVSALLAEGQRVLVTSQKAQALRVLRDKLPESLRRLCVSLTDAEDARTSDLAASVSALAAEKAAYHPDGQARRIDEARDRRDAAIARRDELVAAIQELRAAEAVGHPERKVAPGWSGTRGAIAARLRGERAEHGWLPLPVPRDPAGGPPPAPLTAEEATELWALLRAGAGTAPGDGTEAHSQSPTAPGTGAPGESVGPGSDALDHDIGLGPVSLLGVQALERLLERERAATAEADTASRAASGSALGEVAAALGVLDTVGLDRLTAAVEAVTRTLEEARRTARRASWLPRALDDALAGRDGAVWGKVTSAAPALAEATEALGTLGLHAVTLPAAAVLAPAGTGDPLATPAARMLAAGEALRRHLDQGGSLRRMFRSQVQRDAADLLAESTVDGRAPTTPKLLDLVIARLRAEVAIDAAARAWALAGVNVGFGPGDARGRGETAGSSAGSDGGGRPGQLAGQDAAGEPGGEVVAPEIRLARLTEAQDALGAVVAVLTARDQVHSLLASLGTETGVHLAGPGLGSGLVDLGSADALRALAGALALARLRLAAAEARAEIERPRAEVEAAADRSGFPAELRRLAGTLAARDLAGYRLARDGLLATVGARRAAARREVLLRRLRGAHPALAELLLAQAATGTAGPRGAPEPVDDDEWRHRLVRFEAAWSWGLAAGWFTASRTGRADPGGTPGKGTARRGPTGDAGRAPTPGAADLDAQLDAAEDAVAATTAELAGAKAWKHCLERMGTRESAALRAYADAVAAGGRFAGRHADRYRQAAREAMAIAQTGVPAWVMPIAEVLATIPAVRDSFDVVIVDEGSQAGLDSLFLLWLAPRVIIVGDDRQCAPAAAPGDTTRVALTSADGEGLATADDDGLDPMFRRLDALLPDLPGWLRVSFTPRSSLFSLLRTRFGEVIRLREHFRCMPEIIEWSSAMFYRDAPLVPLRQFGADRLPPLRARYVPHAYTTGAGAALRNSAEAEALVSQVLSCAADPRYDGASFGVVVLQGTGQADLVRSLLAARMSAAEQQRRRLRVGTPPDFQGDERDVVFLSMVVTPDTATPALTRQEYQRRFNVAASRARDQMWLFHSVGLEDLRPDDLRHSHLGYVLARSRAQEADADEPPRLDQVSPDIPHPRFDSLFEQRVFRELTAAGYRVLPQVEVNGRRIDLVVAGGRARLAVECDGDEVGTPAQVAHDFARERQLRRAGWPFWRVRQSDFESDPAAALASLWPRLSAAAIGPAGGRAGTPETGPAERATAGPAGAELIPSAGVDRAAAPQEATGAALDETPGGAGGEAGGPSSPGGASRADRTAAVRAEPSELARRWSPITLSELDGLDDAPA
ncbi:AAA domain-containing protein [Pseudofrankia sp. BMG5.37]|uniref:AAA domain-containing protein n=1 Tax=Pseudofrankia sp. BMG5.37 TaxID=3050035 RepID=UPI002893D2EE|nr:AAA domain-containing protein [Pseudofrankia sp. BMG5.37]MDT3441120.1 AAA domain-containing protein [Pseudofrankia sp. BMG5.37]